MALAKENFNSWVFGGEKSEKSMRDHPPFLCSRGRSPSTGCGRGSIPNKSRNFASPGAATSNASSNRVEESRSEFEAVRKDYNAGRLALSQLEPLSTEYQVGPFGPDSFFEKTLRKMETDAKGAGRGEK